MKHIGNLSHAEGAKKKRKRIGRGQGSGHGGTSTRGHKGQMSRSGAKRTRAFEGGQMPLNRRLPKFGFYNPFSVKYEIINVATLQELVDKNKIEGKVDAEMLRDMGIVSNRRAPIKILGDGDISAALEVSADRFSNSAKQKIEQAGGTVITNG
ncbi:MAG: 50S ribosomal protein L15 [Candidatus Kapaibacterium sp.]